MQYEIKGEPMPVVICQVAAGESMITERGSMVWMSPNMEMSTGAGGIGKAFGRMFSGDSIFQNTYTAVGGPGMIAFGSSLPGTIRAIPIDPAHPVIVQKRGFLASEQGVELSIHFQKKMKTGFFGGEGFIMQKLSGYGMAFVERGIRAEAGPEHCSGYRKSGHDGRHLLHRCADDSRCEEYALRRGGAV